MDLFNHPEDLDRYLTEHSTEEDPVLKELARHTYLKEIHPRMLSGHVLGSFLRTFSQLLAPVRILEIGTYTGYGSICLATGLQSGGRLITIEINDEFLKTAHQYFEKAGISDQVTAIHGNALEVIPTLDEIFDLVFIDAHKDDYPEYYQIILDKVSVGGYILADNVLWGGKVLDENASDPVTETIRRFNRMITEDPRVENFILPIRDGIMVVKKL